MNDDWILDVLADLKSFAEQNDLPSLAVQLEDARRLAVIELARRPADPLTRLPRRAHRTGGLDS